MKNEVPVYLTSKTVDFSWLLNLRHHALERTVDNKAIKPSVNFVLAASNSHLFFGGHWDKAVSSKALINKDEDKKLVENTGQFTEGLWRADVLELFLGNRESEDYLELNLSPAGAWWGAYFSSYRERDSLLDEQKGEVFKQKSGVYFKYPLEALPFAFQVDKLLANVTAINFLAERTEYQSWNWAMQEQPDFHDHSLLSAVMSEQ